MEVHHIYILLKHLHFSHGICDIADIHAQIINVDAIHAMLLNSL